MAQHNVTDLIPALPALDLFAVVGTSTRMQYIKQSTMTKLRFLSVLKLLSWIVAEDENEVQTCLKYQNQKPKIQNSKG